MQRRIQPQQLASAIHNLQHNVHSLGVTLDSRRPHRTAHPGQDRQLLLFEDVKVVVPLDHHGLIGPVDVNACGVAAGVSQLVGDLLEGQSGEAEFNGLRTSFCGGELLLFGCWHGSRSSMGAGVCQHRSKGLSWVLGGVPVSGSLSVGGVLDPVEVVAVEEDLEVGCVRVLV